MLEKQPYINMLEFLDFESLLDPLDCNLGQFEGVVIESVGPLLRAQAVKKTCDSN